MTPKKPTKFRSALFEGSKADNDRGVREGSKRDIKRDTREKQALVAKRQKSA